MQTLKAKMRSQNKPCSILSTDAIINARFNKDDTVILPFQLEKNLTIPDSIFAAKNKSLSP